MTVNLAEASPPTATVMGIAFELNDPEDQDWVHGWRAEGASEDTVACCAVSRIYDRVIRRNRDLGKHVVVTSFQKSASTFLSKLLVEATGFRLHLLHATGRDNERDIEIQRVPLFLARNTISQEHMRATLPNIAMLGRMGVRPIVLVRNVFDALVSLRDHWIREEPVSPIAHVPAGYAQWSSSEQLWFAVRMATPWYLNFYASWMTRGALVDALWISYDEVVRETIATAQRALRHSGVQLSDDCIAAALNRVQPGTVRFNHGVSGRGLTELSREQRQAVVDIAASFNGSCDFSRIGL